MPDTSPVRVLIADDQADVLNALRLLLLDEGFEVIEARSPAEAVERIEATDFDRKPLSGFDEPALTVLRGHAWPGNVRELAHAVERAVLMVEPSATSIGVGDLGLQPQRATTAAAAPQSLEDAERQFIEKVLADHGGDVREAAQQLGMSRSALYRRLQQYGVRE